MLTCPRNPEAKNPDPIRHYRYLPPEMVSHILGMMDDHSFWSTVSASPALRQMEHKRVKQIEDTARKAITTLKIPNDPSIDEALNYIYHLNGNTGSYDITGIHRELDPNIPGHREYRKKINGVDWEIHIFTQSSHWTKNNKYHRIGGPSKVDKMSYRHVEQWHTNGRLESQNDLPSEILYDNVYKYNTSKCWHKEGVLHRDGGPASITYYWSMKPEVLSMEWYKNGSLHRDGDEPAQIIMPKNDTDYHYENWYKEGLLHRDGDKPAQIITPQDPKEYRREYWYQKGLLHRTQGPAEIYYLGDKVVHQQRYKKGEPSSCVIV